MRLLADAMLGKLCKWLRLLGHDTTYDAGWNDNEIVRMARAEGRVVLTRDRSLVQRRGIRALLLTSDLMEEQMAQILSELHLPPRKAGSRCSVCNGLLEPAARAYVRERVPRHVYETQEVFRHCPKCDRIYWQGGHWARILPVLNRIREAAEHGE